MTELYAPPDVEGAAVTMLNAALTPPVSTRVPNPRPATFVRITRAGGQGRNLAQSDARLLVECWADDSVAAFDLARLAYAHLWAARDSYMGAVWVTRVDLTDPVNFPDPALPAASRYQFLATLTTSLTEVTP